jgi:hypothetical protein
MKCHGMTDAERGPAVLRRVAALAAASSIALAACGQPATPSPTVEPLASQSASVAPDISAQPSVPPDPYQDAWVDVTAEAIGETGDWSNKVELADINADGRVDLLFANGGDYDAPGTPVASHAFVNNGDGTFTDATAGVFGDLEDLTRVIKVRDLNADGWVDILMGTVFDRRSRLLLGAPDGSFTDATRSNLPDTRLSVGDLEIGDVDADGDLDVVLADWGDGNPFEARGRVQLWLNDGNAAFTDATAARMPDTLVGFSWDIELVDTDNDWDLDLAVSCKSCPGSLLYENDGDGTFADVTEGRMPAFPNNYEFAPVDLDGNGTLDLLTINDGPDSGSGFTEHLFDNADGTFADATGNCWPADANPGYDDNVIVAFDVDSDGDADFVIGSLDGPDRLVINDGCGDLRVVAGIIDGPSSQGTLGWGVADLNGDGRPDMVESQGEVPGHEGERVYLATEAVPPDTAVPVIRAEGFVGEAGSMLILARVHDNRTPNMPHDWQTVEVRWDGADPVPMAWYGENLFRAAVSPPAGATGLSICAVDAAGNEACELMGGAAM